MKGMIKVVGIILVVLLIFIFAKNTIAKSAVSAGVKVMTGLKISIKDMNVGMLNTLIGIRDLKLYNPEGFKDKLMVDIPEIHIDYHLGAFLKKKVHLEEVRLDLKEFIVVKNEKGELNLDSLKVVKKSKEKKEEETTKKSAKVPPLQIDVMRLKIGKVVYKDYSRGGTPKIQEFNVNIDERYENITNPYTFASLIVFKALMNTSIASLANFDIGPLKDGLDQILGKAAKMAEQLTGEALTKGVDAVTAAKDVTGTAKEAAGKASDTIKKLFPFGK